MINASLQRLWVIAERSRERGPLSRDDVAFIRDTLPSVLSDFPKTKLPKSIRHPAGFTVSGRPVGTFLRAALLLAGQKALGRRFAGHEFYGNVERDLALGIMRSNFQLGYPKGTHCCVQCTLAIYPVLVAGAIRYFDGPRLAKAVNELIRSGQWRFAQPVNAGLVQWALGDVD